MKLRDSEQAAAAALARLRERASEARAAAQEVDALPFRINGRRAASVPLAGNRIIERALRVGR